jgi:hypothetical protein
MPDGISPIGARPVILRPEGIRHLVPWIIDYQHVLEQMQSQQMRCLYYNSGAFGFASDASAQSIAWIGAEDPSIKPGAREFVRQILEPYESNLATHAADVWQAHLRGRAWIMPMSHWAYELDYGAPVWLPPLLEHIGIDPGLLQGRNNAAAIEFSPDERVDFQFMVHRLLEMLSGSDFMIAFPNQPVLCMIHHHRQLWWSTPDPRLLEKIDALRQG